MRVTKREVRAAMAQRPIVDFTEPSMRPIRTQNHRAIALLTAILSAFRVTG